MNADHFTVKEVKTFRLDHECNEQGCERVLTVKMIGTQAAANTARSMPPPNVNGWVDGYCPDHATQSAPASATQQPKEKK